MEKTNIKLETNSSNLNINQEIENISYTEKENSDLVTCQGSCNRRVKKKINPNEPKLIGDDFKSIGSFHTDKLEDIIKKEILLNKEQENEKEKDINNYINYKDNDNNDNDNNLINLDLNNVKEIKKLFMQDPSLIYLNHGAFGSPFLSSYNYSNNIRRQIEMNPVDFFDRNLFKLLAKGIIKISEFLNCDPFLLMPLTNVTTGLNAIFKSLTKNPSVKNIVIFDTTYSATNIMLEDIFDIKNNENSELNNNEINKINLHKIDIPLKYLNGNKEIFVDFITEKLPVNSDLIILDHISSQSCINLPLRELINNIRKKFEELNKSVLILVDGAHAPGSIKINLAELDCDFYLGNLHKWICSTRGGAFLFSKKIHINSIRGAIVSHGHADKENSLESFYWDGNKDYSGFLGIIRTLEIWKILENKNFYDFLKKKTRKIVNKICEKLDVNVLYSFEEFNSAMVLIKMPEKFQIYTAKSVQDWLHNEYQIELTIKKVYSKLCTRLSVQIYVSDEDIDRLIHVLKNENLRI
jgi:isopenicillin-N epimerase